MTNLIKDINKCKVVDGSLMIPNSYYRSYCKWFHSTLTEDNKKELDRIKLIEPSRYKFIMCNTISASYQSITKDYSGISKFNITYTNGSYIMVSL
jgi:hypothetical protein